MTNSIVSGTNEIALELAAIARFGRYIYNSKKIAQLLGSVLGGLGESFPHSSVSHFCP